MIDDNYVRLGAACHCGQPARVQLGRGRPPKHCEAHRAKESKPLKLKEYPAKECPACRGFFTSKEDSKYCCKACWLSVSKKPKCICMWCSAEFKPTRGSLGMYCSASCRGKHVSDKCIQARVLSGLPARISKAKPLTPCSVCGTDSKNKQCSRACALAYGRLRNIDVAISRHRQDARVTACAECKTLYCPLYGSSHTTLCTPCSEGRSRASKAARRVLRKAMELSAKVESVDPHKVFDRDGWHCRICGISTPLSKRGSYDDDAPELDHIRPLSKRGEHSYRNTQCACRKCNASKSDEWVSGGFEVVLSIG